MKPEGRLALAQALKEFTPPDVTVEEPIGGTQPPAPTAEHRHQEAEHRLRELREAHEAADERIRNAQAEAEERVREVERVAALRVAAIEGRLREGQAAAFQRITAAETLERETAERMRAVERRAEQRVAEVQEASLSRIAELEAQLAALRPAPQAPPAIPQGPDPRKWWQQG